MEKKGLLVGALSLFTVILGIIGAASNTSQSRVVKDHDVYLVCDFQATPAVGCGVVAALLALTTQIVASAATGCCGLRTWGIPGEAKRAVAVVLSTASWVLAIIVMILFFVGATKSNNRYISPTDDGKCIPPGTAAFVAATVMFVIAVVCQIISYILLQATAENPLAQEQGIAIVQPVQPKAPLNADQQAAADGDPPPSAPPVTSEVGVVAPPPATTESSKASATVDPTSQV